MHHHLPLRHTRTPTHSSHHHHHHIRMICGGSGIGIDRDICGCRWGREPLAATRRLHDGGISGHAGIGTRGRSRGNLGEPDAHGARTRAKSLLVLEGLLGASCILQTFKIDEAAVFVGEDASGFNGTEWGEEVMESRGGRGRRDIADPYVSDEYKENI